ncbi:MAG: hypothetical protein GF344_00610 [Chitinivibrionales bacterium]|nr:hypothetical protein [Chitinivibrionales bacterium]MBD3355622.1 hypothetical protein [Chitinivibrionales bacterium]
MNTEMEYDPDEILAELDDGELFIDESNEDGEEEAVELDFESAHASGDFLDVEFGDLEEEAA